MQSELWGAQNDVARLSDNSAASRAVHASVHMRTRESRSIVSALRQEQESWKESIFESNSAFSSFIQDAKGALASTMESQRTQTDVLRSRVRDLQSERDVVAAENKIDRSRGAYEELSWGRDGDGVGY